jgi:3-dehydroquinate dehydratase-2
MKKIGILNGPNLDRLGTREPGTYGSVTLGQLGAQLDQLAATLAAELKHYQSAHEGALVEKLWQWSDAGFCGVVFNPAAYTHTSIALRDAIVGSGLRVVEVHISHVYQREAFRHQSMTAAACAGVICGLGLHGYAAALRFLATDEP